MNFDYRNYAGAFLVIKNKKLKTFSNIRKCLKHAKEYSNDKVKYCPNCGKMLVEIKKESFDIISYKYFDPDNDIPLRSPQYPISQDEIYLFPDSYTDYNNCYLSDSNDLDRIILWDTTITINDLKNNFIENFKYIIDDVIKNDFKYEIKIGFVRMIR